MSTKTGRWPSEPNMQNLPIRTKLGARIRTAFLDQLEENRHSKCQGCYVRSSMSTEEDLRCLVLQWTPVLFRGWPHPVFWDVRIEKNVGKHTVWVCAVMERQTFERLPQGWDAVEVTRRLRDHLASWIAIPLSLAWDVQIIVADPPEEQ